MPTEDDGRRLRVVARRHRAQQALRATRAKGKPHTSFACAGESPYGEAFLWEFSLCSVSIEGIGFHSVQQCKHLRRKKEKTDPIVVFE